jgi:hypothetical protein
VTAARAAVDAADAAAGKLDKSPVRKQGARQERALFVWRNKRNQPSAYSSAASLDSAEKPGPNFEFSWRGKPRPRSHATDIAALRVREKGQRLY